MHMRSRRSRAGPAARLTSTVNSVRAVGSNRWPELLLLPLLLAAAAVVVLLLAVLLAVLL